MITAYRCFHRCVELCRKHGLGRIEVANLPMAAFTRQFVDDLRGGSEDASRPSRRRRRSAISGQRSWPA